MDSTLFVAICWTCNLAHRSNWKQLVVRFICVLWISSARHRPVYLQFTFVQATKKEQILFCALRRPHLYTSAPSVLLSHLNLQIITRNGSMPPTYLLNTDFQVNDVGLRRCCQSVLFFTDWTCGVTRVATMCEQVLNRRQSDSTVL